MWYASSWQLRMKGRRRGLPIHWWKFVSTQLSTSGKDGMVEELDCVIRCKLNCDATYVKEKGKGVVGAVVRDDRGEFMGAYFKNLPSILYILVAEEMTIREVLELAAKGNTIHTPK
ncbi:hypothetical protein LIER_42054 [Lithospermum erythrorhizon]|uniref:RNase H type-1 domain-containing protein n=1 Tax=Lithospermum erythrorhizon TaxID=34254 RepID=A0AAV3RMT0_LITER